MIKKISVFFVTFLLIFFASACFRCDCKDYRAKGKYFKISNSKANYSQLSIVDSLARFMQLNTDSVDEDKLGVYILFEVSLAKMERKTCFHLINTANACKCVENTFKAKDPITKIEIFTINDFDAAHHAGANVTDYFVTLENRYNPNGIIKNPITNDLVDQLNTTSGAAFPQNSTGLLFYLNQSPNMDRNVSFKIVVTHSSGEVNEAISSSIYLKAV